MTDLTTSRGLGCAFLDAITTRRLVVDGRLAVEIELTDDLRGPGGSMHGGLVSMLVDVAGASCLAAASGRPLATSSVEVQYLASGRVGPVRAVGEVLRLGDTLGVAEVRVVDVGREERLMAVAHIVCTFLSGDAYVPKTS
ncbi:MAG TPA: PaaI family thioesterase [Acidimicrobiia bacterium]|nr:PaaI family thioesterase [Acidimicrobiia bacterium]